jgi:hypothetical protein
MNPRFLGLMSHGVARETRLPDFVFNPLDPVTAYVGYPLSLNFSASIAEATTIVLQMTSGPVGAVFTDNEDGTGTLQWTPSEIGTGTASAIITAGDVYGRTISRTLLITIEEAVIASSLDLSILPVVLPSVDISAAATDFVHWGLDNASTINRKTGVDIIGALVPLSAAINYNTKAPRQMLSWSGGDPTATAETFKGNYSLDGFSISVPASPTEVQEFQFYSGRYNCETVVTAELDGITKTVTIPYAVVSSDNNFSVKFSGTGDLTLTVECLTEGGNIKARAAKLMPSFGISWSEPLEVNVYEPLSSTLTVSGYSGGTLSFNATSLPGASTLVDNGDGTATLSFRPSASDVAGSPYIFGVDIYDDAVLILSKQYTLTVSAATDEPPVISAGDTLVFSVDTEKSVTFTATGATPIALSVNGLPSTATWNDNGNSTATLTWTAVSGDTAGSPYQIEVVATDVDGRETRELMNVSVGSVLSGSLTYSMSDSSGTVDLTAEGTVDWAHWFLSPSLDTNRKAGVTNLIGDLTPLVGNVFYRLTNSVTTFTWSDGSPTATSTNTTGCNTFGSGAGYSLTVPAGTTSQTLTVIIGGYNTDARFTATLSDGSASPIVEEFFFLTTGRFHKRIEITFNAESAGQTLTLEHKTLDNDAVHFFSAALS